MQLTQTSVYREKSEAKATKPIHHNPPVTLATTNDMNKPSVFFNSKDLERPVAIKDIL